MWTGYVSYVDFHVDVLMKVPPRVVVEQLLKLLGWIDGGDSARSTLFKPNYHSLQWRLFHVSFQISLLDGHPG
jgi:hypothetical protein